MAADSGREQITEDIVHALDTATGGHFGYGSTMRWRIWPPESYPSRVVLDEEEVFDVETEGLLGRRLAIRVVSWHSVAFGKSDEPAKAASRLIADTMRDVMADRTRHDLAVDTLYAGSDKFITKAGKPNVLVEVRFAVVYRTSQTDPSDVR